MKYFARKSRYWPGAALTKSSDEGTHEITSKYALELYKELSKAGQYNLVAVPNFRNGVRVDGKFFSVWGEYATEAECFNRRLKGTLANDILNKRIADE